MVDNAVSYADPGNVPHPRRIMFVSANAAHWGGSEELWAVTAAVLAEQGHRVSVWKPVLDRAVSRVSRLETLGVALFDPARRLRILRIRDRVGRLFPRFANSILQHLRKTILDMRPELVVISQGANFDGCGMALVCKELGVRYALLSHKADDIYWPSDQERPAMGLAYAGAHATFFVSEHSRRLTEEQLATALPGSVIVRNPFQVPWDTSSPWPDETDGLRLACVGRIDMREKGQAVLLRILAMEKWRRRPIRLTFYGTGHNAAGLRAMADFLKLDHVRFAGFTSAPETIWRDHHALILSSRCEGLPLVEVEAMLSGRVVIATDVGGNAEVLTEGQTGFLAMAPTAIEIDAAMERAWARRADWPAIGRAASAAIRGFVPADPAARFAEQTLGLLQHQPFRITLDQHVCDMPCDLASSSPAGDESVNFPIAALQPSG